MLIDLNKTFLKSVENATVTRAPLIHTPKPLRPAYHAWTLEWLIWAHLLLGRLQKLYP